MRLPKWEEPFNPRSIAFARVAVPGADWETMTDGPRKLIRAQFPDGLAAAIQPGPLADDVVKAARTLAEAWIDGLLR